MYRDRSRRIVPIIIVIIIIVLAIFAIVSLGRAIFSGGTDTSQQSKITTAARQSLLNTSVSRSVSLTVRGKLIADESYRSYKIVVSPQSRVITTYKGYLDSPITTKEYDNNTKAYEQFVYALDKAGFVNTSTLTDTQNDTRGLCAGGNIFDYDILNENNSVAHMWTTSCKSTTGSMRGSVATVKALFAAQIPDYDSIISNIHK